jgi:flagellar M-ring protein FliF
MEFFRRSWTQIIVMLQEMTPVVRLFIGSCVIIAALILFVAIQYTAAPHMVPISTFASDRQPEVVTLLRNHRIDVQERGGMLHVPTTQHIEALSILQQAALLNNDTSRAFDQFIANQTPFRSNAQNSQAFLLAKQRVLAEIIRKMAGVRNADVMIATPEHTGFGRTHVRPSASVNVVMEGRSTLNKGMVEAIAGLVAGAIAEMQPQDVVVIDANQGRQFTVKTADDVLPGETLEHLDRLEQRYYSNIMKALGYIPGVIVAVNVRADNVLHRNTHVFEYARSEPLRTQYERETERQSFADSGEGGVRPNTQMTIPGDSGGLRTTDRTMETRSEFAEQPLTMRSEYREAGQAAKQVNVTVNVPRSFFVSLYRQANRGAAEDPDDATLEPIVNRELAKIELQVKPLITTETPGVISAHIIPDTMVLAHLGMEAASQAGLFIASDWPRWIGFAALGLIPLGLMLLMVRWSTRKPPLPTVEELAGIPPALLASEDIIGEADTEDMGMTGIEINERDMHSRRIAEQISELVKANPAEAAQLFNRWVRKEGF